MTDASEKKSPEKLKKERTISRREALKRIALAAPMIAILPSCGGTRQNINSEATNVLYHSCANCRGYTRRQYALRESDLTDLKKQGIGEGLIEKLRPLTGIWFTKDEFTVEVEELIGKADSKIYLPIIITVAYHARFNKGRECGRYLSCSGITVTGDCCDDGIIRYARYSSLSIR